MGAALGRKPSAVALAASSAAFLTTFARPVIARAEECVVRGAAVSLQWVVVRPTGASPLHVSVYDLPATARILPTPGAPAPLTFAGTVAFAGAAKNIWYELAKPARTHHGIVHLARGARLVRAHAEGTDVVGQLVWSADDILEGEDKNPDAWIAPVRVPCASLRLARGHGEMGGGSEDAGDDGEDAAGDSADAGDDSGSAAADSGNAADDREDASAAATAAPPDPGDGTWWQTRRGSARLVLHASPREASRTATLRRVDYAPADVHWPFQRVAEHGRWMKVTASRWSARVTGWIPRADLEPLDGPPAEGGGCSGNHGVGLGGHGWGGKPPKIAYKGPAEIAVGTTVYAGSGGDGAWATVVKRDGDFEVVVYEGRAWAEVTRVPGVNGAEMMAGRAYVRVGAVRRGEGR